MAKDNMSKIGSSMIKFEVEKFYNKEIFNLWQKKVKVLLVQQGNHMTLQGKLAKSTVCQMRIERR